MVTFGEWIREERTRRRLTRAELAQRVGCSVAMLRKIEGDERRPSAQIAELLANAFDIAAADRPDFVRVARGELGTTRLPVPADEPQSGHAGSYTPPVSSKLPVSPTPLIGRQEELANLNRLIRDPRCRLLTLVGAGGIGKTRLAIELASQIQDEFEDGICFVQLGSANSMRMLVPVIADAIGFAFEGAAPQAPSLQLFGYLQTKRMLLLLDNLEHLLAEPGIEILSDLLAAAPGIKLLITSREPVALHQEHVFELRGLAVPTSPHAIQNASGTSVELFLQRARRAHAGFDPQVSDFPAIVRICQLVDGMPLALELAGPWVRTLSCAEIAEEIERDLDTLSTRARDVPARHRSMRAVFDHSWELLGEDERGALARLSIFRGGFDREAAQQVASAHLRILSALVTKSLVRRTTTGRYELHELIRQYAALHLEGIPGACVEARREHYSFFLGLAEAADLQLRGRHQQEWLQRLEHEHDNLRAALEWSLTGACEIASEQRGLAAMQLAGALRWYWRMRSLYDEGIGWLRKALMLGSDGSRPAQSEDQSGVHPRALHTAVVRARARAEVGLALLTDSITDHASAHALALDAVALFRESTDKHGEAEALMLVGQALRWQGQVEVGRERLQEALRAAREAGDPWITAQALYRLGAELADFGRDPSGRGMLDESAMILEGLGDKFLSVNVLIASGIVAFGVGDYAAAREKFEGALAVAREIGDPWGTADALTNIGCVERVQANYSAAQSHFEAALKVYKNWGEKGWCADPLCALAENALSQGDLATAGANLAEARKYADSSGNSWLKVLAGYLSGLLAYYQGNPKEAALLLEESAGLARASQYSPDLARALVMWGRALGRLGASEQARQYVLEGLTMFWQSGCQLGAATALEALAGLAPPEKAQWAARLLAHAEATRRTLGTPLPPVDCREQEGVVTTIRSRLGEVSFAQAWTLGSQEPCEAFMHDITETFRSNHPELADAAWQAHVLPPRPPGLFSSP